MLDVAIIGAGELGGTLAQMLAARGSASHVRLIDPSGAVARGKALDIAQAGALRTSGARVTGSHDVLVAAASSIIVVADAAGRAGEPDDAPLLEQILLVAPRATLVCAQALHRPLVEHAVRNLGVSRGRVVGSAPEALASALRACVALEARVSPRDVSLTVLGVPPHRVVVPWEEAAIGGLALTRSLDETARRRLAARLGPLWPPGPVALAAAATQAIEAIGGRSRRPISCFVGPDPGTAGRHRTVALPVCLGPSGIASVQKLALSAHEQTALDNAMLL
jgi:malate dehydrogenase